MANVFEILRSSKRARTAFRDRAYCRFITALDEGMRWRTVSSTFPPSTFIARWRGRIIRRGLARIAFHPYGRHPRDAQDCGSLSRHHALGSDIPAHLWKSRSAMIRARSLDGSACGPDTEVAELAVCRRGCAGNRHDNTVRFLFGAAPTPARNEEPCRAMTAPQSAGPRTELAGLLMGGGSAHLGTRQSVSLLAACGHVAIPRRRQSDRCAGRLCSTLAGRRWQSLPATTATVGSVVLAL